MIIEKPDLSFFKEREIPAEEAFDRWWKVFIEPLNIAFSRGAGPRLMGMSAVQVEQLKDFWLKFHSELPKAEEESFKDLLSDFVSEFPVPGETKRSYETKMEFWKARAQELLRRVNHDT